MHSRPESASKPAAMEIIRHALRQLLEAERHEGRAGGRPRTHGPRPRRGHRAARGGPRSRVRRSRSVPCLPGSLRPGRSLPGSGARRGLYWRTGLRKAVITLGGQRDPPRPARRDLDAIEFASLAPIGNGRDRHVELRGRRLGAIAPVAALARRTGRWPQRTATLDPIGIAEPSDLTGRKGTPLPTLVPFVIETVGDLRGRCDPGPSAGCARSPQAPCGG